MVLENTVFLIGPRAAGKTLVGARLAAALPAGFVDTDLYLAQTRGLTPAEVVRREGWAAFRRLESLVLREAAARCCSDPAGPLENQGGRGGLPRGVVATGGGVVLDAANRAFMRASGLVLYLSAPAEVLAARLAGDPSGLERPSLTGRPPAEEVPLVLAEREALYREAAHQIVDASGPPEEVLTSLLTLLRDRPF